MPIGGGVALRNANDQIQEVLGVAGFLAMSNCHRSPDAAILEVSG